MSKVVHGTFNASSRMLFGIPLIEKAIIYIQITELVLSLFVNKKILQGIWHHFLLVN